MKSQQHLTLLELMIAPSDRTSNFALQVWLSPCRIQLCSAYGLSCGEILL